MKIIREKEWERERESDAKQQHKDQISNRQGRDKKVNMTERKGCKP